MVREEPVKAGSFFKTQKMQKAINFIKVRWVKKHWDFAYPVGSIGTVDALVAPKLLNEGFIIPLPDEKEEIKNPLPENFPARDRLFDLGFTTVEGVKEAGESLLSEGLSNTTLKKINAYIK